VIVSYSKRFIFIKTAKTAGTSLIVYLANQCHDGDLITYLKDSEIELGKSLGYQLPHGYLTKIQSARLALWKLKAKMSKGYLNPAVPQYKVRKNLDAYSARMFVGDFVWNSYYKFCFERNPYEKALSLYFYHTRDMNNRPELNEYILNADRFKLSNWHLYTINDEVAVDFVGKFEALEEDVKAISEKLGFSEVTLPRLKSSSRTNHQHYSQLISQESRLHIEKMCAKEIEKFGYKWENQPGN